MNNSIISEGKTTQEAIDNGLKALNVSKDKVDVKVLENENKKSFFSILTPRVVKVELTLKEKIKEKKVEKIKREYDTNIEDLEEAKKIIENFIKELLPRIDNSLSYTIKVEDSIIYIDINGDAAGILIGYRGETLNAMQTILSNIANRNFNNKIRIVLNIENYRE